MKKLYVGNLPWSTSDEDVMEMFEEFGPVESLLMMNDRVTGRFRGFCFVEMSEEAADAAIAALDGREFDGRALHVSDAGPHA